MKKTGVLNKDLSELIAGVGHKDKITICDAGLPIPDYVWRIDLAIKPGLPGILEVIKAIAEDLKVEEIILAEELKQKNSKLESMIREIFELVEVKYVPHEQFKEISIESRAIVRTGECTPYANVILVSGVTF